jgi:hypothetical protein
MRDHPFIIRGTVVHGESGDPLPGLRVEVWDADEALGVVAEGTTGPTGEFVLNVEPAHRLPLEGRRTQGFVRVYENDVLVVETDAVVDDIARGVDNVALNAEPPGIDGSFTVKGRVLDTDDAPRAGATVRVFDVRVDDDHQLGEDAKTDDHGRYEVRFVQDDLKGRTRPDVRVRVYDASGKKVKVLVESAVQFSVGRTTIVNLSVGTTDGTYRGPSEFTTTKQALDPVLGGVSAATLSDEQIAFVAHATGVAEGVVRAYAGAATVAKDTSIGIDTVFALARGGLPAETEALVRQSPDAITTALETAKSANLAPPVAVEDAASVVSHLQVFAMVAALEPEGPHSLSPLLQTVLPAAEAKQSFLELAAKHLDDGMLWGAVAEDETLSAHADDLRFAVQAAVLTQNCVPLVQRLQHMRDQRQISDAESLAGLTQDDWLAVLSAQNGSPAIEPPKEVPGADDGERRMSYAHALSRITEDSFPATALRLRLQRDDAIAKSDLGVFLRSNPNFAPGLATVDGYLAANPRALDGVNDRVATVGQLHALERLAKFAPRFAELSELMTNGVGSAFEVKSMGKSQFTESYGQTLGQTRASQIWDAAAHASDTALNLLVDLAPAFNKGVAAVPFQMVTAAGVPNWEELFGSIELCDCADCRTVLSPAAYFTDILKFMHDRPAKNGKTAKDVLFERRPDLGEIELTCENTNTPLPYVDLLDEILERAVAPTAFTIPGGSAADLDAENVTVAIRTEFENHGYLLSSAASVIAITAGQRWHVVDPGWRFPIALAGGDLSVLAMPQTSVAAADLAANPEHENAAAYDTLSQAVYPISLPFDLWLEDARAYLTHLGVTRSDLMQHFRDPIAAVPDDPAIAAESLGLTAVARQIVTWTHPQSAAAPYVFWGVTAAQWPGALRTVQTLLDRASLTYVELEELLRLKWLNGAGTLSIASDTASDPYTCDPEHLQIPALDADAANRIQRFVRLWRPLGWTARDLDKAIAGLGSPGPDDDLLRMLADISALCTEFRLPVGRVLGWFSRLDTATYPDTTSPKARSLYQELFQNPSVIKLGPGETDPFALDATPELAQIVDLHIADADAPDLKAKKLRLRAAVASALGLSQDDLMQLLEGQHPVTSGTNMTLENLSRLYRYASFARALKLKVWELLAFERLYGTSPFVDGGVAVTPVDTKRARDFVESIRRVRASGFSIPLLAYLLRQETLPGLTPPSDDAIATLLDGLRSGLRKIVDATTVVPDPLGQAVGQALATLGWDAARVKAAVDTVGGTTVVYTSHLDPLPAGAVLPAQLPVAYEATSKQLTYTGAMTTADRATLLAVSVDPGYQAAVLDLFGQPRTFVATAMSIFVDPVYTTPLEALPAAVHFPTQLASRISYDSDAGILSYVGTMSDPDEATLLALSADASYQAAITALHGQPTTYVPPAYNAFLTAADGGTLFDAAQSEADRYAFVLTKLYEYLRRTQSEALVKQTLAPNLKLGVPLADVLLTQWADDAAEPTHRALQEFLEEAFVSSTDKPTAARFPRLVRTYLLLWKVARIVDILHLSATDVSWLAANAGRVGWIVFSGLPSAPGDPALTAGPWERLVEAIAFCENYGDVRSDVLGLLETAVQFDPATGNGAATKTELLDGWSALARWPEDDLEALAGDKTQPADRGLLGLRFPVAPGDPNDYADERTWYRLADAFADLRRLGASPTQAVAWSKAVLTSDDARNIKQAARSKYDTSQWYEIAPPLRDAIRGRQRAALVDYLLANPGAAGWKDARGITEYFLIDCEMGACMRTSRIKQAIGSVQMFAQRCLMNLEPEVDANVVVDPAWAQWEWMKSNRVWVPAREIFLWPENWIEPELRDGKSPFFEDLENALGKKQTDAESVEDAFLGYLEQLDEVAQLTVGGVYHQLELDLEGQPAIDTLHVFGRTSSTPPKWFYRKRVMDAGVGSWTAWEKVDAEIDAEWLLPVIWNRRLFLIWPDLQQRTKDRALTMPSAGQNVPEPMRFWRQKLSWTERHRGKWTAKKTTKAYADSNWEYDPVNLMLTPSFSGTDLVVRLEVGYPGPGKYAFHEGSFTFVGSQPGVVNVSGPNWWSQIQEPQGTVADEMTWRELDGPSEPLKLLDTSGSSFTDVTVLDQTPGALRFRIAAQNPYSIDPDEPLFFADGDHSYFVTSEEVKVWLGGWGGVDVVPSWIGMIPWQYYQQIQLRVPDPVGPISDASDPPPYELSFPVVDEAGAPETVHATAGPAVDGTVALEGRTPYEQAVLGAYPPVADGPGYALRAFERKFEPSMPDPMDAVAILDEPRALGVHAANGAAERAAWPSESFVIRKARDRIDGRYYPLYLYERRWKFEPFYHPYIRELISELAKDGVPGLLQRPLQISPWLFSQPPTAGGLDFGAYYDPTRVVLQPYPSEDVDFSFTGAYSLYNWELFFHAPILIATRLSQNQKFEDAQKWLHYVFDPTDTSALPSPQKYWRTRHFYETTSATYQQQRIENLLNQLASGSTDPELVGQVAAWRKDPFNPHKIARLRTTAYQRSVVMKYLDNLISWGDQLFRGNTIELINEATQVYILAADILGRKPELIPSRYEGQVQTYNTIEPKLDAFSNALVAAESLVPPAPSTSGGSATSTPTVTLPALLYFSVPKNGKLMQYWDIVGDRLYKIRHCMNIEGIVQQLPLFDPPFDPAMLVAAAAAGVDLASALSDISAPLPAYKFQSVAQKATELCQQTITLGNLLLAAMEKRDAEDLALLRATNEVDLLDAVRNVRLQRVTEAADTADALRARQAVVQDRSDYYQGLLTNLVTLPYILEGVNLLLLVQSGTAQAVGAGLNLASGIAHFVPDFKVGSPTTVGGTYGGSNVGAALGGLAASAGSTAGILSTGASASALVASWLRRAEEWQHQKSQADLELKDVAKQIAAADLRQTIAQTELDNHDLQRDQAKSVQEFMHTKFTNRELYDWMVGQVSTVYFQSYQLAYDLAKRAERCYRHELGLQESNFIRFGYWDSLKEGLLSGERLYHDLKRMEAARLDQDRREYELMKVVSLAQVDPAALVKLKETGACFVNLPESLFDADHPGHYMRRLKTVALTVPCVAGPYTGVNCTLSYLGGTLRVDSTFDAGYERTGADDRRFVDYAGPIQSIATSAGQSDSGLFELTFRDERYLPFEGEPAADSSWRLQLDKDANRFDLETITDVVLHIRYTAREGGDALRDPAKQALPQTHMQAFSARHDFSDAWHRFVHPAADATSQLLELDLSKDRFPYQPGGADVQLTKIDLYLKVGGVPSPAPGIPLQLHASSDGTGPDLLGGIPLASADALDKLYIASADLSGAPEPTGTFSATIAGAQIPAFLADPVTVGGVTYKHLDVGAVEDLVVVCTYEPV